jgi:hypothetical protein
MTRVTALLLAAAAFGGGLAGEARADLGDTLLAIGYVSSVTAGALSTAVNGSHLAFGEGSPRGWRIFGYVVGGIDVVWGAVILAVASDRAEGVVVGGVALAIGAASLATAHFVDEADDRPVVRPVAWPAPGGAGVSLVGRF